MSGPSRQHPSAWALWPTVGATWVAFAQILSFQGLAIWVIGGSLLSALAVLPLALAGRRLPAAAAAVAATLAVPLLAEWLGGNTAGPVTRASLMASAVVGAMCLMLPTRYPVAILPASLLLLGGALGLGAAGQGYWLVGMWAVAAGVTVAMVGPLRQEHLRERARLAPFALMLLASGLASVLAVAVAAPLLGRPWTIPGSQTVAVPEPAGATPPPSASPSSSPSSSPSASPSSSPVTATPPSATPPSADPLPSPGAATSTSATPVDVEEASSVLSWLGLVLLAALLLLLLILLALVLWRVWAWWRWARLERRLSSGSAEEQVVGAWTWVRLRRARTGHSLPVSASPDVAVEWAHAGGDADTATVAAAAAGVAFNPAASVPAGDARRAWASARLAGRTPGGATLRQRWRWSACTPSAASGRLASPTG